MAQETAGTAGGELARAHAAMAEGRYQDAATMLESIVARVERTHGASHLEVAAPLNLLAMSYHSLARFMDAGLRYQRALAILEAHARGKGHEAADIYHNLGGLEHAAGNWLRGEPFARHAVMLRTKLFGRRHPAVAADITALAALLDRQGQFVEAERLYHRALTILELEHGAEHHLVAVALNNLAAVLHARGKVADAEAMFRRAQAIEIAVLGPTHPTVAYSTNNLAILLKDTRRPTAAAVLFRKAVTLFSRGLGANHPHVGVCLENLSQVLRRTGDASGAKTAARRAGRIFAGIDAVTNDGVAATGTINPWATPYRLIARASAIHRIGVFSDDAIAKGHKVIEYTGERISRRESGRRWDPKRSYLFELTEKVHLDGAIGGSGAEYINHSCEPNLKTRIVRQHILYYSTRPIAKGEELTVDYRYDHDTDTMRCYCGAPGCRGSMNLLPPKRKKKARV